MSRKSPRGLLCKSFNDCVMFHLPTVFPNNAAEQEKYYLSNVLKKPQRVGVCHFVQRIEQLKAYVPQLLYWYYSPSYITSMMPENVHSPRLIWRVTFSGCVHTSGRTSTTCKKRA